MQCSLILISFFMIRISASPYEPWHPDMSEDLLNKESGEIQDEVVGIKKLDDRDSDDFLFNRKKSEGRKKTPPCSVVLISSSHHIPAMQTLLRKYRYDSQGVLIPNSVRYFMKTQTGTKRASSYRLVPLNDQSFSPMGGFVRYYKEVPPIPQIL